MRFSHCKTHFPINVCCRRPRGARNPNVNVTITNACAAVILFGPGSNLLYCSTKNVWNAKNVMLSWAACVFVPWITWKSCTAAAPSTPIVISWSLFMLCFNHFVRHKISQLYCYKPHSKHWAFTVKSAQHFTSGLKIFHYTKSHKYNTRIKKIILNGQLITIGTTVIFLLTQKHYTFVLARIS